MQPLVFSIFEWQKPPPQASGSFASQLAPGLSLFTEQDQSSRTSGSTIVPLQEAVDVYAEWGLAVGVTLVVLFAIVLAHEFGHVRQGRREGIESSHVTLSPLGGLAHLERDAAGMADAVDSELASDMTLSSELATEIGNQLTTNMRVKQEEAEEKRMLL